MTHKALVSRFCPHCGLMIDINECPPINNKYSPFLPTVYYMNIGKKCKNTAILRFNNFVRLFLGCLAHFMVPKRVGSEHPVRKNLLGQNTPAWRIWGGRRPPRSSSASQISPQHTYSLCSPFHPQFYLLSHRWKSHYWHLLPLLHFFLQLHMLQKINSKAQLLGLI